MKPIVVAMEVSPSGEVLRESFTMVNETLDENIKRMKSLPKEFKTGSYKTSWSSVRVKKADAVVQRGNKLAFKSYLF
jgi:hypothetical protein